MPRAEGDEASQIIYLRGAVALQRKEITELRRRIQVMELAMEMLTHKLETLLEELRPLIMVQRPPLDQVITNE